MEVIAEGPFRLAEGPVWDAARSRLVWTDIEAGTVWAMDWASRRVERMYQGPMVGGMALQRDGALLLFRERDVAVLGEDGVARSVAPLPALPATVTRCNDCLALPSGGVLVGTISHPREDAGLLHLSPGGVWSEIARETGISNGLALSGDLRWLYWTDSTHRRIVRFPFDAATDAVGGAELVHRAAEGEGTPDGLTMDAEGRLWSARWGGGCVVGIDPESGGVVERIAVGAPGANVTSCVFAGGAGPELDVLVVTINTGPIVAVHGVGRGVAEFRAAIEF